MNEATLIEKTEIIFAVEGQTSHFSAEIADRTTVLEFAEIAARAGQVEEILEVFLEDANDPLEPHLVLIEHLSSRFAPLHVARPGVVRTTVEYNGRKVVHAFRPSATIARIIEWAIGPNELNLEGGPANYQLKYKGRVLAPDEHLGQVAEGQKTVEFDLVFKVKPQG